MWLKQTTVTTIVVDIVLVLIVVALLFLVPSVCYTTLPGRAHLLGCSSDTPYYDFCGYATYSATLSSVAGFQIVDLYSKLGPTRCLGKKCLLVYYCASAVVMFWYGLSENVLENMERNAAKLKWLQLAGCVVSMGKKVHWERERERERERESKCLIDNDAIMVGGLSWLTGNALLSRWFWIDPLITWDSCWAPPIWHPGSKNPYAQKCRT